MMTEKEMLLREQQYTTTESVTEKKAVGKCSVCGRRLTDPVSVQRGIGPICRAKEGVYRDDAKSEEAIRVPFDGDIICRRTRNGLLFNIPHRITYHSPTGMEWGYGGSGPADFALNILSLFVSEKEAFGLHQDFKWDFVAKLPHEGGTIKREQIVAWLRKRGVRVA